MRWSPLAVVTAAGGEAKSKVVLNDSAGRAAGRRTVAVEEAILSGKKPAGIYSWEAWGETPELAYQRLDQWRTFYTLEKLQQPTNPTAISRARLFDAVIRWNFPG